MKWKKGACLLTALLLGVSNISYAEEVDNISGMNESVEEGTDHVDSEDNANQNNDTDSQDAEDDSSPNGGEDGVSEVTDPAENSPLDDDNKRVIWGRGRGITPATLESDADRFGMLPTASADIEVEAALKNRIERYKTENQKDIEFGQWVRGGQIQGTKTAYYEYENTMIVTSDLGTFSVRQPILNILLSSGGVESLGAPVEEQLTVNGHISQKFENGTLTGEMDKKSDTLVVRRGNVYYFKNTLSNGVADKVVTYGWSSDEVLVGDWNGDGRDTPCVRRGNLYYFKNSITGGVADYVIRYGRVGDEVIAGDWDGDGKDTLCVRRGNVYYFKNSIEGGVADYEIRYGRTGDNVLVGDWDGDGKHTLCVRRSNTYYFKNSISGGIADSEIRYGRVGDEVLTGDWNGDGRDTLCVRRQNAYYIKNSISGGVADATVVYGRANDITYSGSWSSNPKMEVDGAEDLSFNLSRGFEYTQLSQAFAGNCVNGASFRKSALTTHTDNAGNQVQYCAYYDSFGTIVLARRQNEGSWEFQWTGFKGDISDAHNAVSLAVDGTGYLHMSWSHHSGRLMYAKSVSPDSMEMKEVQMIGTLEDRATYPEFYVQPSGDMFFLYRNGSSGNGNIVLNRYSVSSGSWQRVQDNLISGEGRISPYWQACVDSKGRLHISWVWRETGNVTTNYNMSYAVSTDASGSTFVNSLGDAQLLPITESTSEVICEIPKDSALINQTSMTVDNDNKPYIISYWRVNGVVQYNIIRFTGEQWIIYNTDIRNTNFDLSGIGTRQLPCGRPQILVNGSGDEADIYVLFRDDERDGKSSIAKLSMQGMEITTEKMIDITASSLGEWEPNYDIELWNKNRQLHIFLQKEYYHVDGGQIQYNTENIYVINATSFIKE